MPDWDIDSSSGRGMSKKLMTKLMFPCICVALFVAFIATRVVEPAHLGIVSVFGSVSASTLESGLHFVNPFAHVVSFNLKTQLLYTENIVPTKEGLSVELDVALLYHLNADKVRDLFVTLGVEFEKTLIMPELQSAVRGLTSEVSAKALYTSGRTDIRDKLVAELEAKLGPRGIILEDVLLKGIKLPEQLIKAIEIKAQAEQESARMEFVLSKEKQEAERKKVEAEGISSFQRIVSEGISAQLLQWKGIEATEKLAKSDNAKLVVMGNTKDSLPVLLSTASADGIPVATDRMSAQQSNHDKLLTPTTDAAATTDAAIANDANP